jgi:tetratricopeptide (TPR) repeat protein
MKRVSNKKQRISRMDPIPAAIAFAIVVALLSLWGFTERAFADTNLPKLVAKVKPAVLFLKAYDSGGKAKSQATGFFITKSGHFVTNFHFMGTVIRNTAKLARFEAFTPDGKRYPVTGVLAENLKADLVVGVVALPQGVTVPYLRLAKHRSALGEGILVIGNPKGLGWTISEGIVSGHRRLHEKYGAINEYKDGNFDQITAPITHGSSGGPVMNMRGEVVSVVSHMNFSMDGAHAQLHFASVSPDILALTFQDGTTVRNLVDNLYLNDGLAAYSKRMTQASTNTERAHASNLLGIDYLNLGDVKNAKSYFDKALVYDPAFAAAHYNIGLISWRQKDWHAYLSEYRILIELDKKRAIRLKQLGMPKGMEASQAVGQPTSASTSGSQSATSGVFP